MKTKEKLETMNNTILMQVDGGFVIESLVIYILNNAQKEKIGII